MVKNKKPKKSVVPVILQELSSDLIVAGGLLILVIVAEYQTPSNTSIQNFSIGIEIDKFTICHF